MRFANIDMSAISSGLNGKSIIAFNTGDFIQTLTISYLYQFMGIAEDSITVLKNRELQTYSGEPLLLPINMLSSWPAMPSGELFSPSIYPVFLGASFPEGVVPKTIKWLKRWEPIGCRDEKTYSYLKNKGVKAFLSGCLTIALPKREQVLTSKVFFVDAPEAVFPFVPKHIIERAVYRKSIFVGDFDHTFSVSQTQYAKQFYQELAHEAVLVVTGRLHVASPCIAMGIPVILCVNDVIDARFSWIDKYITIYQKENYDKINWNPETGLINIKQKELILNTAAEQIWWKYHQFEHQQCMEEITEYYLNREKTETYTRKEIWLQIIDDILKKIPVDETFYYTLWGVHYRSQWIHETIQASRPKGKAKLVAVYDTYKTGEYLGHIIQHPEEIRYCGEKIFHFVCATWACGPGKALFDGLGLEACNYCLLEEELQKRVSGNSIFTL